MDLVPVYRLKLPPHLQRVLQRGQRRVQHQAVEVVGAQVLQAHAQALLHLRTRSAWFVVRDRVRAETAQVVGAQIFMRLTAHSAAPAHHTAGEVHDAY